MSFVWPWVLLSLAALPFCIVIYGRLQQRRARNAARLGTLGAAPGTVSVPVRRRHVSPLLYLLGLALLAFASARPQVTMPLPRLEGTLVFAFDASASMAADDVYPTRMDSAKATAHAIVDRRPDTVKIGVVAVGDTGLVVQKPTNDDQAVHDTIDRLVPQSWTLLGSGILSALDVALDAADIDQDREGDLEVALEASARSSFAPAIIVLLSDGENTDPPDPLEAAQAAINQGVRVYTVGFGTPEGTTLEIDGFNLFTQLNEGVLQEIALLTEGSYYKVEGAEDVPAVYEDLDTQFVVKPREVELTPFLAGLTALVLISGGALSLLWFGRVP